jgi:predicted transcriptional regulator
MVKGRSKFEIYMDVLNVISRISRATHIMYAANLSWIALRPILEELQSRRLVEVIRLERRKEYKITGDGQKLLQKYGELLESSNGLFHHFDWRLGNHRIEMDSVALRELGSRPSS